MDFLRRQVGDYQFYEMWKRVGEWSYGLTQGFPFYKEIRHVYKENIAAGLQTIATTNLKKTGGGGVSDFEEIRQHAERNKDLWTAEIEIIKPDVVICGGTYWFVKEMLGLDTTESKSGAETATALGTRFVDFYHPAYRVSPKVLYAYFTETMKGIGY